MPYTASPTRYESMLYNRCGKSGLKLPAISLGLWHNFGFDKSPDSMRAICRRAFDLGDRKSTRLNSSHRSLSRMPSSA